jgi:hygromycin-B 7''-O-kinase
MPPAEPPFTDALLPRPEDESAFLGLRGDPSHWVAAMRVICERHGLSADALYMERTGTNVVFKAGDGAWIKLIPPFWRQDHERERCALRAVAADASIPAPPLLAEGEIEGWTYLVLGTVEGVAAVEVWEDLPARAQVDLAEQIGALMKRIHAVEGDDLTALTHDWRAFMRRRREACVAQHARHGATPRWQREIAAFLEGVPASTDIAARSVLLHADITDEHVRVAHRGGRWLITGLIDFADAMLGAPLYEFAAPAVFMTQRQPDAQRGLLRGYGIEEQAWSGELARRLTAFVLLHRFSALENLLRFGPGPPPKSMAELHTSLWGFADG